MKTIELRTFGRMSTKEVLLEIVRQPVGGGVKGGVAIDDMRADIRLMDKIEPAIDSLSLEDADWARLCRKVKEFPFAYSDRNIISICDAVLEAKDAA